jgi:tetratricopeptide (TPR) repeat protein
MEQDIASLGALGQFELALERAQVWAAARPQKIPPKAALVRLHHAARNEPARDAAVEALLAIDTRDLNELEEARLALGELELWGPQIRVLDRMDDLAPSHPVILANRGAAFLAIEEMGLAETDLKKAIETDQNNAPALATLGLIRMRQDRYVGARELLERAVGVAPDKAQVHVYLAACKNNQGDRNGAIEALERALKLEPDHAQAKQLLEELTTN